MKDSPTLRISELFFSIQGESSYAGQPCVFIRLHGCNLRCTYCDARYTYEEKGKEIALEEIIRYTEQYPGAIIEITGGEPLLQPETVTLAEELCRAEKTVLIETNGSLDISVLPRDVVKIIDIKCPDSGMSQHVNWDTLEHLGDRDELKFVLSSRNDYEWAIQALKDHSHLAKVASGKTLFSPVIGSLAPEHLADWILTDQAPVRLQLQLHKQLWPTCQRGV